MGLNAFFATKNREKNEGLTDLDLFWFLQKQAKTYLLFGLSVCRSVGRSVCHLIVKKLQLKSSIEKFTCNDKCPPAYKARP